MSGAALRARPGLVSELAAGVAAAVRADDEAARAGAVAAALRPFLGAADLIAPHQRAPHLESYARHLLHADPAGRFSIWAMVWRPGQGSAVHDHRCWCVMGAYEGVVTEEAWRPAPGGVAPHGRVACRPGAVRALHPGIANIHRVFNDGGATAISIHVYGFDPATACSSVGRTYDAR